MNDDCDQIFRAKFSSCERDQVLLAGAVIAAASHITDGDSSEEVGKIIELVYLRIFSIFRVGWIFEISN